MPQTADFLIIGGGVAGLSAGARLAAHGRVVLLEAEEQVGYHSSGRSVTFSHYGIGDETVRALTSYSRAFFLDPPEGFEGPLCKMTPALFVANEGMLPALDRLEGIMRGLSDAVERLDEGGTKALCPAVRWGADAVVAAVTDRSGLRLDPHTLLQGFSRRIRPRGGEIRTGMRVDRVARSGGVWRAQAGGESFEAPILIDAAGAWADAVAGMAGVQTLGLSPMRRTIIVFDPPAGMEVRDWPFVKSAADYFYMLPDVGRLLASPVEETPMEPCDAQADELDMAIAAHRVSEFTTLEVRRISHRWAGLRTFARDRVPVAGYAPDAEGFFWLAGQGGYGLQTAPAMAEIAEALALGRDWPESIGALGVGPEKIKPDRLFA